MDYYSPRSQHIAALGTPSRRREVTPTSPQQQRPTTSGSYAEPKSHYLHQALMERRALVTPQPQVQVSPASQSTPHRPTPSRRPSTNRGTPFRDEWTSAAAAEHGILRSQSTGPRLHGRRMSDSAGGSNSSNAGGSGSRSNDAPRAGLTIKESNVLIDRLQKENFDLKLRITLQDDKMKKLARELDDTLERIGTADQLAERCACAEEKAAQFEQQLEEVREQIEETWSHNQELVAMSEELARELNERDGSIDEAANIIHELEKRVQQLEELQTPPATLYNRRINTQPDSDYFSGEAESPVMTTKSSKGRPGSSSGSSILPADSDYYSATSYSSPASAAPKRPRPMNRRFKTLPVDSVPAPRRRANSDKTNQTVETLELAATATGQSPTERRMSTGRAQATVSPTSLQPAAVIQSSPDPPVVPRPGLRRTRKGQATAIASLRLQVEQQDSGPATPRAPMAYMQAAAPGSAPSAAIYASVIAHRKMHSVTPIQHIPRASSEPPQDWSAMQARPLRSLYMTGELNRPVTSDIHAGMQMRLRAPGEAPPDATPTVLSLAPTPVNGPDDSNGDDADSLATTAATSVPSAATPARPLIWRDRSNMSQLALAVTNARLRSGSFSGAGIGAATATTVLPIPDDQMSDDSGSPTATIPETISSQVDLAARRAQRLNELGSEYSGASTVRLGSPSEERGRLFGKDVLFRP